MSTMTPSIPEELPIGADCIVEMPLGLLGFEQIKKYRLLRNHDEAPFLWLQMLDGPGQAFIVVPPAAVVEDYRPDLSSEDVSFLDLADPKDAWVLNIVTLRRNGDATVNLKGPIVCNRRTRIAKQIIPLNAAQFPLQHPLAAVS